MDFLHRTWAEIDLCALKQNYERIRAFVGEKCKLMPVVKANAYGHSVQTVAPVLRSLNAQAFAVSNIDEAIELREYGIERDILILGYTPVGCAEKLNKYNLTQCVYSEEYAKGLSENAQISGVTVKIHIKLDTGMGRIGFDCRDNHLRGVEAAIDSTRLCGFDFKGIFTHFAVSDRTADTEDGFTDEQYSRFCNAIKKFKEAGLEAQICHCCNSAALCLDTDKYIDMCRLGIILYGLTPADNLKLPIELTPVMTLKSVVSMVKEICSGDSISYGRTFTAEKPMKIATVTAGYADGYPRLLSNRGEVLVHGRRARIVGRICMDQFTVDVTDIPDVSNGDEVVLFGKDLPVEELAQLCETINYEIVCGISRRVPRIAVE